MRIGKIFTFDAAHSLPKHKGKCKNLHGHTYKLEVELVGAVVFNDKSTVDGMVMDFEKLSYMVKEVAIDHLDHSHLNDKFKNPTAELVAVNIFTRLDILFETSHISVSKVKLWETPTSYVECRYEDIQHIFQHQRGSKL